MSAAECWVPWCDPGQHGDYDDLVAADPPLMIRTHAREVARVEVPERDRRRRDWVSVSVVAEEEADTESEAVLYIGAPLVWLAAEDVRLTPHQARQVAAGLLEAAAMVEALP